MSCCRSKINTGKGGELEKIKRKEEYMLLGLNNHDLHNVEEMLATNISYISIETRL